MAVGHWLGQHTLENPLVHHFPSFTADDNIPAKILSYNRANRAVAILCNHQRAPPKTFEKSMMNLQSKVPPPAQLWGSRAPSAASQESGFLSLGVKAEPAFPCQELVVCIRDAWRGAVSWKGLLLSCLLLVKNTTRPFFCPSSYSCVFCCC